MKTFIKSVLPFLAIGHSLAIAWTRVGCDAPWVVERIEDQEGPMTIDMDAVWANVDALSKGARAAIASLDGFETLPSKARKNVVTSAEYVLPVDVSPHRGVHPDSQENMADIVNVYEEVESALAGALRVHGAQRGYIFCGGDSFTKARIPGIGESLAPATAWFLKRVESSLLPIENDQPVWSAAVIEAGEGGSHGTTDYIILDAFRGSQQGPCMETDGGYVGKTVYGRKAGSGPADNIIAVVLCPNKFKENGLRAFATLDEGYATEKLGYKRPYIANYGSVSGTLLHEMVHVVGHARDPTPPPAGGYHDHASGFREVYKLARGQRTDPNTGRVGPATRDEKVFSPDGYRLFAEMCRSPDTTWGHPDQKK
ncbi:hypothetical protein FALBO_5261 [Fusarium albosuccineum]|uniref:Lysine-specific metallo-endopeptidase domain-containing protein n=1 Tax=Fusarium albosuccineum TaxID=1237068 RepID=A0A8H4LF52_9HYPO|nr:hypothetical protein FALBO_5261 [Fusarium albosuccineum]